MDIFLGIDLMKGQWAEGVNPPQVLDRIPASDSSRKTKTMRWMLKLETFTAWDILSSVKKGRHTH